jgi:hypothetical protein
MSYKKSQLKIKAGSFCKIKDSRIGLFERVPCFSKENILIIDASEPVSIKFSEQATLRSGTTAAGEISQTYSDGTNQAQYTSQYDETDKSKYVDWVERARYAFYTEKPGIYYRWERIYLPKRAGWNHYESLDGQALKECSLSELDDGCWFWWKSPHEHYMEIGGHFWDAFMLLGGKRLQAVLFTDDPNYEPKGLLEASQKKEIDSCSIETELIFPDQSCELESLTISWNSKGPLPSLNVCDKNNKNYFPETPIAEGENNIRVDMTMLKEKDYSENGIKVQIRLEKDALGQSPEIGFPQLSYKEPQNATHCLESGNSKLFFDKEGNICEGTLVINGAEKSLIPAFSNLPNPELAIKSPGEKGTIINDSDPGMTRTFSWTPEKAINYYSWLDGAIKVTTIVEADKNGAFNFAAEIKNNSDKDVLSFKWPCIENIAVSECGNNDTLMLPRYEPQLINAPSKEGFLGEVYPRGAMNWMDISDGNSGIYICALDSELILTRLSSSASMTEDCVSLSIQKDHRIRCNGGQWNYNYKVGLHEGDWHWGADRYREYFYQLFPRPQYPEWMIQSNGWCQAALASVEWNLPEVQPPAYEKVKEHHIDRAWRVGADHIQTWGQGTMDHACPTYYLPDPERGGCEKFAEMFGRWKEAGIKCGSYFHSSSLNPFFAQAKEIRGVKRSDIPEDLRPPSWQEFIEAYDYSSENSEEPKRIDEKELEKVKKHEAITPRSYPKMSCFSEKWRKYIRTWIKEYVEKYSHTVIYHDQLGNAPQKAEFNKYLGLHGEGNGERYVYNFIQSLHREMSVINPDFAQVQEAVTDALAVYAAPMTSGFHRNPEVYRYTFPDHEIYYGQSNGMWKDKLQLNVIRTAFLEGMKFDLMRVKPDNEKVIWLRDSLRQFFFNAKHKHNLGASVNAPASDWRCFQANDDKNDYLIVSLLDVPVGAEFKYDSDFFKSYEKAFFFNLDGKGTELKINKNKITLPACQTGALLLTNKVSPQMSFWFQALPDENADGNGIIHYSALDISGERRPCSIKAREFEGNYESLEKIDFDEKSGIWNKSVKLPSPYKKRLLLESSLGFKMRRLTGKAKGTYWGYPNNRKNLRFHYHPMPQEEIDRIMKYDY